METVKVKFIHDMNQAKPQYRGLMHGMRTIIAQEGFRGCYKVSALTFNLFYSAF